MDDWAPVSLFPVLQIRKGNRDNLGIIFHITPLTLMLGLIWFQWGIITCFLWEIRKNIFEPQYPSYLQLCFSLAWTLMQSDQSFHCLHIMPCTKRHNIKALAVLQIRRGNKDSLEIIIHVPPLNIFCDLSLEPSHWDGSNEGPQHMFSLRNKKILFELSSISPLIWSSDMKALADSTVSQTDFYIVQIQHRRRKV